MDPFCYVVSEVETTRGPAAFCIWEGEGATEGKCPELQGDSPGLVPLYLTLLV